MIQGHILRPAVVRPLPEGAFAAYMKSVGRLGGQNKIPRLSNDRTLADGLQAAMEKMKFTNKDIAR